MNKQETKLYFYIGCSQSYGTLHGMWSGNIEECTYNEASDFATAEALDVITEYSCFLDGIHEDANAYFGYDDTPSDPSEEYLDYIEDSMAEEVSTIIFEIMEEGTNHLDAMEEDMLNYEEYLENGWLKDCN